MSIAVRKLSGALGAEVSGIDLWKPLDPGDVADLRRAILDHGVVFLRGQKLSHDDHLALARALGEPDLHPIANGMAEHPEIIRVESPAGEGAFFGTSWHTDNSFFAKPSAMTILRSERVPPTGGDTLFASMERAWEVLSEPVRRLLEPLRAVHSAARAYDPRVTGTAKYEGGTAISYTYSDRVYEENEHPVMRTHPETGRKSLYVNPMFTERIVGLNPHESAALLAMLHAHATRPDFTCRVSWEPGQVTIWDNRSVQHYAIDDYHAHERILYRVTLEGTRPV
ncbi:MAG TPA: TauD/TfdA family dioxygenase [Myxococcota bacterium]|nr:TauD/TfdA family dioxygenase [Myxococcota bacterium]